jgi:hypothetical protein
MALTCKASFFAIDNAQWQVTAGLESSEETPTFDTSRGRRLSDEISDALNSAMLQNFIQTGLMYELVDPLNGRVFYGKPKFFVFSAVIKGLANLFSEEKSLLECSIIPHATSSWTAEDCQANVIVASLWSFLVALLPRVSYTLLPAEDWSSGVGYITRYRMEWYLSTIGLMVNLFLLIIPCVIFTVCLQSILARRQITAGLPWWKRLTQAPIRTGLYGTASTILGLTFCFHDSTVRKLFRGSEALGPDEAGSKQLRKSVFSTPLWLRRWRQHEPRTFPRGVTQKEESEDVSMEATLAFIKAPYFDDQNAEAEDVANVDQEPTRSHGYLPMVLKWWLLVLVAIVLSVLTALAVTFLAVPRTSTIWLWTEPSNGGGTAASIRRMIHQLLLSGLPPLVLGTISSLWWDKVDQFFRCTQPFAVVNKGAAPGSTFLGVTYINSFLGAVSLKAIANGHWVLGLVSCITFLGRVGIFFSAGIFKMSEGVSPDQIPLAQFTRWRNGTFPAKEVMTKEFATRFRNLVLSLLVFDYRSMRG